MYLKFSTKLKSSTGMGLGMMRLLVSVYDPFLQMALSSEPSIWKAVALSFKL